MAASEGRKPSRTKETPGLLMSIIRTLSNSSADVEQREKEKARLERAYKESDRKLNGLVQEQLTDLTSIIQAFSKISSRITASQERIHAIKDNLQSCKNLLHCKRDELRKLWLEGIEHKTVVVMLDQIESMKDVNDGLQGHMDKKQYLHATEKLASSVSLLEGDLSQVEGLRDVKVELLAKREELYENLLEELHKQIYVKSTSSVMKGFQRQGSQRQSKRSDKNPFSMPYKAAQSNDSQAASEKKLELIRSANLSEITKPQQITEDLHGDPEDDPVQFIAILVECIGLLNKLPEAIDALRSHIKSGLMAIVQRASQQVADNAYLEGEDLGHTYQPQYLLELLELVFQQFRIVAQMHQIVLANMTRIKDSNPNVNDICLYDMVEVWIKIQSVLQLFLSDYLDIRNTASSQSQGPNNFDEPSSDIGSYFAKKRPTRPKKFALFRFDASSHAISMNSYLREQRQEFYGSGELLEADDRGAKVGKPEFVCKPCATNITAIYNPLQKFIREIESATKAAPGSLTLQTFLTEFIKSIYLGQVLYNVQTNIDLATKGSGSDGRFDAQRTVIDLRTQRDLGVIKPLLQSTVSVARNLEDLQELIQDLPDYADQFLSMMCKILQDYSETCHQSYKSLVQSETDEKRIISATWARDEDISRFLKSLPNWHSLHIDEASEPVQMSEKDLRAMNSKESSILTSNLSSVEALIPQQEIITDVVHLKTLANLCESLEWFSSHIVNLAQSLKASCSEFRMPTPDGSPLKEKKVIKLSESSLKTLTTLADDFQGLAQVCLIVLHLEVRVHCFYYLMPLATHSNYSGAIDDMDPDANVIKLNKDLAGIEEVLQQSLQAKRFKYVFEGLGHLVSSILINSTQYLKRINENGIKKMCRNVFSIQQCLTNITMNRESDLDHARQYYELLYLSIDEILKAIVERGAQFTEHEFTNLLALAHRSERGARETELGNTLKKLEEILTEYESTA